MAAATCHEPGDHLPIAVNGPAEGDAVYRLAAIVESSTDAIVGKTLEGVITSWNRSAERIFGYTAAEIIGRHVSVLIPPERLGEETRILAQVGSGERVEPYETVRRRKDGSDVDVSLSVSPVKDATGRIIGASKIARDISEQVHESELRRRSEELVANSIDAIYRVALDSNDVSKGTIQTWNRAAELLFGYTAEEVIGKPLTMLIPAGLQQEEFNILARLQRGGHVESYEATVRTKAGREVVISLTTSPLRDDNGRLVAVAKIARDISAQKRAEEAARESEEQLRTLADNIAQFAWIADPQGSIFWFNKRWYEYTGTTLDETQGWGWVKFHHPDHVDGALDRFKASLTSGEPWEDVFPLRGKDGEYRWFLSRALPIRDSTGRIVRWLGTNTDVTEQRMAEEALRHGAMHDALTDLPNRAYFIERLSQAFARMQRDPNYRIAVLLLDCDGFKSINDTLGHLAGDKFLTEIAARLRASVRPGDVVARLGGDEFTALLEDVTGPADADRAARHIQDSLAAPLVLEGRPLVATVSIGAALSDGHDQRPQDLLHHADLAMYHAKRQGRARFQLFDAALRDSARARVDMETDLREALERQQFRLVFQPIVGLETARVRSVEALLRWRRPRREAVTPLDIIAVAERTGLILQIGRWVLREACRNARAWQDAAEAAACDREGPTIERHTRVSVNLSAKQFWDADLVTDIRSALQEHGLKPSMLILEVPERVLVSNVEAARTVLQRLRELGVAVLIDDFGTGSSLIHLSRFPVEGIKLDRILVHRIGARRTEHFEILRSIMDVARSLGLAVTAEGVETAAQRDRLLALGCEVGQGYLFAKPLEPKAAGALLAA